MNSVVSGAPDTLAVFTTVAERDDARRLAQVLVQRGLAACAQISEIESFYHWDGRLQQERELRIVFKTTAERYVEVEAAIREMHPYELPAIHAVALDHVYEPYAAWIATHSDGGPG